MGSWKLMRYGRKAVVDERVIINDSPGAVRLSISQLGRAAKRCWLDLAWATILSNPVLANDSKALFHADHGNYSASAVLSDATLGVACSAVRNQTITPASGKIEIVHLNLQPKYLIVPPDLEYTAREILRLRKLDDSSIDLQLRVESRLGPQGVVNPATGVKVTGSALNWLVTCDNSVAPWLLRGILEGQTGPRTRVGDLRGGEGQYGMAVDVSQALTVSCCDYKSAYFSVG
jgi:hypothetical protein